ncbi:hypothetical protein D3C72_1685040 [compost metagenome]
MTESGINIQPPYRAGGARQARRHAIDRGIAPGVIVAAPDPEARTVGRCAKPRGQIFVLNQYPFTGGGVELGRVVQFLAPVVARANLGVVPVVDDPGGRGRLRVETQIEWQGVQRNLRVLRPHFATQVLHGRPGATARVERRRDDGSKADDGRRHDCNACSPPLARRPGGRETLTDQESQRRKYRQHIADQLRLRDGKEHHHHRNPDRHQPAQPLRIGVAPERAGKNRHAPD